MGNRVFAITKLSQQHNKFITAKASDRVNLAQAGLQAIGYLQQQQITRLVPVSVIQGLEPVQAKEDQCVVASTARAGRPCSGCT